MVKQDIERQYDDDLTLGTDEYDDSYYTDADDLFDFSTNDESPISRLKSLVLSIDWEITDEVLLQFNEELIDLKGIWANNSINLVYVQALEKISKYIYQNKANSHPNSIKLLLTLYYNLEKIVSSQDLTEAQKKEILLEDVKRFEGLKRQIGQQSKPVQEPPPARPPEVQVKKEGAGEDTLLNLKAIVLGIDWEITDQDLNDLRREVIRLEEEFAGSRPKLILLQGIGTLGAYIKTKKSNAHADAFNVLHLFYESLEKIVQTPMSLQEEKNILFPAVEKFNSFKALLGPTISPEAIGKKEDDEEDDDYDESVSGEIAPAFADIPDDEVIGFQAEEEAKSLGISETGAVASQIDDFFGESFAPVAEERVEALPPTESDEALSESEIISVLGFEDEDTHVLSSVERELALQGVDVEADDEEEVVEKDNRNASVVAALSDQPGEMSDDAEEELLMVEDEQPEEISASDEEVAGLAESIFPDEESLSPEPLFEPTGLDRNVALQGVDVETEADEDSDELSLPMEGDEFAPALLASDEESIFSAATLESSVESGDIGDELSGTLDDLFLAEEQISFHAGDEKDAEEDPFGEATETTVANVQGSEELSVVEQVGEADEEQEPAALTDDDRDQEFAAAETEKDDDAVLTLQEQEEDLDLFFTGSDLEESAEDSAEVDTLFESLEPTIDEEDEEERVSAEDDEEIEAFFDQEEASEKLDWEEPLTAPVEEEVVAQIEEEESAPAEEEEVAQVEVEEFAPVEEEEVARLEVEELAPVEEEEFAPVEMEVSSFAEEEISEEEEVVFELAEESVEAPPVPDAMADDIITTEEPELEWADEDTESTPAEFLEADDDSTPAFATAGLTADTKESPGDPLSGLHACIESLGIELDDKVILGLREEINALRREWADKPLEKTFLQLLSTITQHIHQYRFEASSEAYNLLNSVFKALSSRRDDDIHYSQDLLLMETIKVLEWQQGMLARQTVQNAPVHAEGEEIAGVADAQDDFDQLLQQYEDTVEEDSPSAGLRETLAGQKTELGREIFAEDLKQEIATLRMTLQQEIAELRSELKNK